MIVVRLWGGLGNQMFQYSFGYAMAKRTGEELFLDTRFYTDQFIKKNPHFSKQLPNILTFPLVYKKQMNASGELKFICLLQKRMISRLIRIPTKFEITADKGIQYIKETRLNLYQRYIDNPITDSYYDGYWQSEEYFKEYKDEILKQYWFIDDDISGVIEKEELDDKNTVSVHLRFGDYGKKRMLGPYYNYVISPQYYLLAMDEIQKRIRMPRFYVFSNDIERAKELIGCRFKYTLVNEDRKLSDIQEFIIMSKCHNHIISNSTFSWWAAWLNDKGITIAPDLRFGNERIIPQQWIKISMSLCS